MFKCYLDMDGVLVDLHRGVMEHFGFEAEMLDKLPKPLPWDWANKALDIPYDEVWKQLPESFWAGLPWTPEGRRILELAMLRFDQYVYILTNPSESPNAVNGKYRWLREHIPHLLRKTYFGSDKGGIAGEGKLLVDDADHNIEAFEKHGGHGILVPRMWNKLHGHQTPMDYVERRLRIV